MRAFVANWFDRLLILWTFLILSPSGGGLVGHLALSMLPDLVKAGMLVSHASQP